MAIFLRAENSKLLVTNATGIILIQSHLSPEVHSLLSGSFSTLPAVSGFYTWSPWAGRRRVAIVGSGESSSERALGIWAIDNNSQLREMFLHNGCMARKSRYNYDKPELTGDDGISESYQAVSRKPFGDILNMALSRQFRHLPISFPLSTKPAN